jgi:hypothetical protein
VGNGKREEGKETHLDDKVVPIIGLTLESTTHVGDGEKETDERVVWVHVVCSD